jgi:hypothetical protein
MNRFICILSLVFLNISTSNSQWYEWTYRQCGVTDIYICTTEEFQCLWKKASTVETTGTVLTLMGSGMAIGGFVLANNAEPDDYGPIIAGAFVCCGGILLGMIGIPTGLTGAVRKNFLKKSPHFSRMESLSIKVSPSFQLNQPENITSVGIAVSFTF